MPEYVLLLVESPWDPASTTEQDFADTEASHRGFAVLVEEKGCRIVGGDAFDPRESRPVGAEPVSPWVTGYYRIECPDSEAALELARQCPTGGHVVVETVMQL